MKQDIKQYANLTKQLVHLHHVKPDTITLMVSVLQQVLKIQLYAMHHVQVVTTKTIIHVHQQALKIQLYVMHHVQVVIMHTIILVKNNHKILNTLV